MIGKTNHHLGHFDNENEAKLEYRKALYHLERSFDGLDSYHFEKAPKKYKVFLNEMYQDYLESQEYIHNHYPNGILFGDVFHPDKRELTSF